MYHVRITKNKPLLFFLLLLSFGQSFYPASNLVLWYHPLQKLDKKYLIGGGTVLTLAALWLLYNRFNKSNRSNNKKISSEKAAKQEAYNQLVKQVVNEELKQQYINQKPLFVPKSPDKQNGIHTGDNSNVSSRIKIDTNAGYQPYIVVEKVEMSSEAQKLFKKVFSPENKDKSTKESDVDGGYIFSDPDEQLVDSKENESTKSDHSQNDQTKDDQNEGEPEEEVLSDDEYLKIFNELAENFENFITMSNQRTDSETMKSYLFNPNKFVESFEDDYTRSRQKIMIAKDALDARIIFHARLYRLIENFLTYKKENGTPTEKSFYSSEGFSCDNFIKRLQLYRPFIFMGKDDQTVLNTDDLKKSHRTINLLSRQSFFKGLIKDPENIKNFLTYDEMMIAALIGVYSKTPCINDGNRNNQAEKDEALYGKEVESFGAIGARFEVPNYMEWQYIIITKEQNTEGNGYGLKQKTVFNKLIFIWEEFWNENFPTYEEAEQNPEIYVPLFNKHNKDEKVFFNTSIYKKRIKCVIEPHFRNIIANYSNTDQRAVYVSTVGLGSGEWGSVKMNNEEYMPQNIEMPTFLGVLQIKTYIDLLKKLSDENVKNFKNIVYLDFAFLVFKNNDKTATNKQYDIFENAILEEVKIENNKSIEKDYEKLLRNYPVNINPKYEFNIILSHRPPFANDHGAITVAAYPWDSNAFSGNEALGGNRYFSKTGDASNGCATLAMALHNPHINPYLLENLCPFN